MDCRNCEEHFSAVLEESDSLDAQASREHLEVCPACRVVYESFRQTVNHLRDLPLVAPPPDLLRKIARSVDAVAPPRPLWSRYWQPVTAGVSMAACVMMVLWAVVLNPTNAIIPSNSSQVTDYAGYAPSMLARPAPMATTAPPPMPATAPGRPMRMAMRPRFAGAMSAPQGDLRPFPAQFGTWGHPALSAPATGTTASPAAAAGNSTKPADSFAASPEAATVQKPLHKTPGEVQIAFIPPTERFVGALAIGEVVVTSEAEANITLRLVPRGGLRVTNAPGDVLYQGPLRKGDKLSLPVRLLASRSGVQRLQLSLTADVAGVASDMLIVVPEFATAPEPRPERPVTLIFRDTAAPRAIRDMAAAAGARVVLDEGLEPQLVSYDFSAGVPFAVAVRTLCDGCGYKLSERDGVYHISK